MSMFMLIDIGLSFSKATCFFPIIDATFQKFSNFLEFSYVHIFTTYITLIIYYAYA